MSLFEIDAVLGTVPATPYRTTGPEPGSPWRRIGRSREGRDLWGAAFGRGPRRVSLIGGCHADEPVGPAMLDRLTAYLGSLEPYHPLLERFSWRLVPHTNPDGEARNREWTRRLGDPVSWSRADPAVTAGLEAYLRHVARERPGDDLEFGFPRDPSHPEADAGARPEARAVGAFLAEQGPYALHGSFHGMAFAAGPWFLIERGWAERTAGMRRRLVEQVETAGYVPHDIDRGGDKGFHRISRGFTSRPDSRAMRAHFEARGEPETAALFRPSSMEFVRGLGGDPLTLVSEMPLFLLPEEVFAGDDPVRPPQVAALRLAAARLGEARAPSLAEAVAEVGCEPMPLRDQMRFQLLFLRAALETVLEHEPRAPGHGAAGHGAPGHGAPCHGAPGHGAPGHGAPGPKAASP